MNIRDIAFKVLIALGLSSCSQPVTNQIDGPSPTEKEVFTFYRKTENFIDVARVLTSDKKTFRLHLYHVDIGTPEAAVQKFISVEQLTQHECDAKKAELQASHNWTPYKGDEVLFVQIQPTGFQDEMQLLDTRQEIEGKLVKAIENNNLGEWLASDLGPGGGNILLTVRDAERAFGVVLLVLQQNELDQNVVIGRRVLIADRDWFYEVIYPTQYSGTFNTM